MVLDFFREISRIPRGSGNEEGICGFLVSFAEERGLWVFRDSCGNVIIKKPGSFGLETRPPVILQGHMDMVCEKNGGKAHDFTKDPIRIIRDGDYLRADGTTLGADDGIAVAMALELLDSGVIAHPPLEVLFTADEESGMTGAAGVDGSLFDGRRLINLDSEEEGTFFVGCAGAVCAELSIPAEYESLDEGDKRTAFVLAVRGAKGGHSGIDIDKERAHANALLGCVLNTVLCECGGAVCRISGGSKMSAIPRESEALLLINNDDVEKAFNIAGEYNLRFASEYRIPDPGVSVSLSPDGGRGGGRPFTKEMSGRIASALMLTPNGALNFSSDFAGLVETSNNIGVIETKDGLVSLSCLIRSLKDSRRLAVKDKMSVLSKTMGNGCAVKFGDDYPGWQYSEESDLREKMRSVYGRTYGKDPRITAVHAGLECGLLGARIKGLDMISLGPDIFSPHSPDERISVPSVERLWGFLVEALRAL